MGVGLAVPALNSAALAYAPPQRAGMAAGTVNTVRQLGYALSIAALGLLHQPHGAPAHAALNDVYRASAITGVAAGLLVPAIVGRPNVRVAPRFSRIGRS